MPKCQKCGKEYSPKVLKLHKNRCTGQVSDETDLANNDGQKQIFISEFITKDAPEVVSACDDVEQIQAWLEEELDGEKRKTIIKLLEDRKLELAGD